MFARTKRLTLRPAWPEDAPAIVRAIGHEEVVRMLSKVPWPYRLADAEAFLTQTADPQPCPEEFPAGYLAVLGVNSGAVQECQGGPAYNSWYGNGEVDAFNAVTHSSGN